MLTITDPWSTPNGGWHCTNPEDGVILRLGSMDSLFRAWEAHRKSKEQPFLTREQLVDKFCRQLPADCPTCGQSAVNPYEWADLAEWRKLDSYGAERWGPFGWLCLHNRKLSADALDNERWLKAFEVAIPCNMAPKNCQKHFREYLSQHPAEMSSQEAWFKWGVDFHNAVNQRTGKLQMPLEEAAKLYA